MSTRSSKNSSNSPFANDPFWVLIGAIVAFVLCVVALPALALGVFCQRYTSHYSWSKYVWILSLFPSAFAIFYFYSHGLDHLVVQELEDYFLTFKHYQVNLPQWDWRHLWPETWPVWLHTLASVGIIGFWQEIQTQLKPGSTSRLLKEQEQIRIHHVKIATKHAKKRAQYPNRVPDTTIGNMMVIGIPIDDEEQE